MGAVLTAAHCLVNNARQRYTLVVVEVIVAAYVNPPVTGRHVAIIGDVDYRFPPGYLESTINIDNVKWDIAVLTLPPELAVPEEDLPAYAYPSLGKLLSAHNLHNSTATLSNQYPVIPQIADYKMCFT